MRLQLTSVAIALLCSAQAWAQEEVPVGTGVGTARLAIYADSDSTVVTTNIADAEVVVVDGVTAGAHVLIDHVSSASVDVMTAATGRFEETRVEVGLRTEIELPAKTDLDIAYVGSRENDWQSHSIQLAATKSLARDNATLSLSYGGVSNQVGRSEDPRFRESLTIHTGQVTFTQLIDSKSLISFSYFGQRAAGFQSSPYRFISTSNSAFTRAETHPSLRVRQAVSVDYQRYLAGYAAATASYRLYYDDWGVMSHTGVGSLKLVPSESWTIETWARGYSQRAASFFRKSYASVHKYMSNDRELSTFWDTSLGAKLQWQHNRFVIDAKLEGIYYRFLEFPSLRQRRALVSSVGVQYRW